MTSPSTVTHAAGLSATLSLAGLKIRLLLERSTNRALLIDLLGDAVCAENAARSDAAPDLFIADPTGLSRHMRELIECRRRIHPQILPCLLLLPDRGSEVSDALWTVVGDVVHTPVHRREQIMRLQAQARTRRLSIDLAGQTAEVQSRFADLDELHHRLQDAHRSLKSISDQKSQLLGMAAHDLRNPLAVVHQFAGLLADETINVSELERRDLLKVIGDSTTYLLEMVDNLLDVARIDSGRLNLDLQRYEIGQLVRASVELNRILAVHKGIEIGCDLPDEPVSAVVDGPKIRQVIDNLLGNAIKYSAEGTKIDLSLTSGEAELEITVRDQGPGIEPQELADLFEPFQRGNTTGGERGTGLGLTIARRIAEGHGGKLHVTSVVGQGSTFCLRIPWGNLSTADGDAMAIVPFTENPVLIEEDRRRLESWHSDDPAGCLRAIDKLLLAIPEMLTDVQAAVTAGQPKIVERAAYRAGWQLRHLSGAAFEAALRLETAARTNEVTSMPAIWQAFEAKTRTVQMDLVSFRDAATDRS